MGRLLQRGLLHGNSVASCKVLVVMSMSLDEALDWPVSIDDDYGSLYVVCEGSVMRPARKYGWGTTPAYQARCGHTLSGFTLRELAQDLTLHLEHTEHVERT